ncbi:MAG: rane protein of unknown function [Phycisphaerales bacterium]|nr:rane protein of unknown function [Phycisphaerales bacterium]
METARVLLLVIFLASGSVMIAMSIPLLRGWVGPNPIYGFRVRRTLANREVWFAANRYAARWMAAAGVALMGTAVGLYAAARQLSIATYAIVCGMVVVGVVGLGVMRSFAYLRRLED